MIVATLVIGLADVGRAVELTVGTMSTNRVLFIGNSLTYAAANADIGWYGNWGMASSSEGKDYAHLVVSDIARLNGGVSPAMKAVNVYYHGQYEQNYANFDIATEMASLLSWNPDVLVVELGENVETLATKSQQESYAASFLNLLTTFKERGNPTIFVRNTWWPDSTKDTIMKEATEEVGGVWVDLGDLHATASNVASSMGLYTNSGVAEHPSDQGMQAIASGIFSSMQAKGVPEPNTMTLAIGGGLSYILVVVARKRSLKAKRAWRVLA
jgi:hypothetical protein